MTMSSNLGRSSSKLHELFLTSATQWGDRSALILGPREWTYTEINHLAQAIAREITTASASPKRVGIFARRSLVSYTAVVGTLLSGASFVPLNPTLPARRLNEIVEAADLSAIVTERHLVRPLLDVLAGQACGQPPIIIADETGAVTEPLGSPDTADRRGKRPAFPDVEEDVAYILFTSGSTGTPKGVPISHGNALAFFEENIRAYKPRPEDVFSQTFEQSFDLSIFDIFMAWSSGAALCVFTDMDLLAPLELVRSRGITIWFSVPSIVAMQMKLGLLQPDAMPSLRLSLFCGEPLPREFAQAWQQAAPNSTLGNLYGPTELTIACAAYLWTPARSSGECHNGIVPIGRPFEALTSRIIDETSRAVPPGCVGELVVNGPQAFRGYWRNPAATAASFVELPNDDGTTSRFYRTGDLVKTLPSGDMAFVGRRDHQVKIGGHRIELGEIEAKLRALPGIVEAVAYAWPPDATTYRSIVGAVAGHDLDTDLLRSQLRESLPSYMIPERIWIRPEMPRNSSGKLDRRVLALQLTALMERSSYGPADGG